ncbi:hypothetical protein ABC345_17975 [Shouchella sp. 1P09AA]|uniref:hypothetical protein n=1 Tax=unclassified Shouchella TaxID=2893065 RepID=UPI0039A2C318
MSMLKKVENQINSTFNKLPGLKKYVKRSYQLAMYSVSSKIKAEGDIERISPKDGMEYFFGYYDKSPWNADERFLVCLRAKNTTKSTAPKEKAEIVLIDTENENEITVLAKTSTWNVQQGCMLQWLGPNFDEEIIFNDFRDGSYCSVIMNINTKVEKVIDSPVYSVSPKGDYALTLDFSRLHSLREGYGYSNLVENTIGQKLPENPCIWSINLKTNELKPYLNYKDFFNFETRDEMIEAEHKVNHIMISPDGKKFMVLHRWINGSKRYSRLLTINMEDKKMYNLLDDNMVSHCYWKNNNEIIAYARKEREGNGYFLLKDKTNDYKKVWEELIADGHPSFSPDGKKAVTDTYPNRSRIASVYLIREEEVKTIARVHAPFKYDNNFRCDLHPRWNRSSSKICIDSVFEGKRGLYIINLY